MCQPVIKGVPLLLQDMFVQLCKPQRKLVVAGELLAKASVELEGG